jgi:hypothetical protein
MILVKIAQNPSILRYSEHVKNGKFGADMHLLGFTIRLGSEVNEVQFIDWWSGIIHFRR